MQTFISIVIALIIFGLLVLIHEFGHFIIAKKNKVTVNEFSIGMGPRLISHVAKSGTRYSLKLLPIGGSCAMLGEDEDNEEEGSFNSKSLGARMAIVFAGPFFNFILAFILSVIVIGFVGSDPARINQVDTKSAAYAAGLREGDLITEYNGAGISVGREMFLEDYINPYSGGQIELTYLRDGKENTIKFTPEKVKEYKMGITYSSGEAVAVVEQMVHDSPIMKAGANVGDIVKSIDGNPISSGSEMSRYLEEHPLSADKIKMVLNRDGKDIEIEVEPAESEGYNVGFTYNLVREKQSVWDTIKYSYIEVKYQIKSVLKSLKLLVTGKVSTDEISGPVGIVNVIGDTYKETKSEGAGITILTLMNLAIMLSANLGVMNLLPIPALDGGRLFLYIIDLIIRKPIPKDKEGMIHFIGFIFLMALMLFLVFNDIRKLF